MLIVFINGRCRSGKDTFCQLCKDIVQTNTVYHDMTCDSISIIDPVKRAASILGYDESCKTIESRIFLSELLKMANSTYNSCINYVVEYACEHVNDLSLLFVHIRAKHDMDTLETVLSSMGDNIQILRLKIDSNRENVLSNMTGDEDVDCIDYDLTIYNNDTIHDFTHQADMFLTKYLLGEKL